MPRYDYRCRSCGATFEVTRPMARAGDTARCPAGHDDTVKLLSTVSVSGRAGRSAEVPGGGAGGCCGCGR